MKKILLLSALAASLFAGSAAQAQVRVNVQFGAPAYYDPRGAYAADDDYYYMPEYNAYYSPVRRMYFYNEGGRWMNCGYLPPRFRGVAYGRGNWYRVHGRSPWMHRGGYGGGYGYRGGGGYDNRTYHSNRGDYYNNNNGGYSNGGYQQGQGGYNNGGYQNGNGYGPGGNNGYHNGSGYGNNGGYNGHH